MTSTDHFEGRCLIFYRLFCLWCVCAYAYACVFVFVDVYCIVCCSRLQTFNLRCILKACDVWISAYMRSICEYRSLTKSTPHMASSPITFRLTFRSELLCLSNWIDLWIVTNIYANWVGRREIDQKSDNNRWTKSNGFHFQNKQTIYQIINMYVCSQFKFINLTLQTAAKS